MTRYNFHFATAPRRMWSNLIDSSLESGQNPTLTLGAGRDLLDTLPATLALHAFAQNRNDVTTPTVVIGDNPLIWLLALMHEAQTAPASTPALQITYGGPDAAIEIASVNSLIPAGNGHGHQPPNGLPAGYAALLAPTFQAGATLWEALPLALIHAADPAAEDSWLTWAGALVALGLILLALAY